MPLFALFLFNGDFMDTIQPEWLRILQGAQYSSVCKRTFIDWMHSGVVPHSKIGGVCLIKKSDLDDVLKARKVPIELNQLADKIIKEMNNK